MRKILSVGQCNLDHGTISRRLGQACGAEVARAHTFDEALQALRAGGVDLVLVNRVTDADGSAGVDLIKAMKAEAPLDAVPVMLVSNYPDAQATAVGLGALPGFGKADVHTPAVTSRIGAALDASGTPSPK